VHNAIGYNYRLTNVLAAMGCAQMEQLDDYIEAKRAIASRYKCLTALRGISEPMEAEWAFSTHWMYTILVDEKKAGISSRALLKELETTKIQTRPLWQPIHRSPAHEQSTKIVCFNSDLLYEQALSLPCSVGLLPSDQSKVIDAITNTINSSGAIDEELSFLRQSTSPSRQ
jgi:perosamine synthetase